MAMTEWQDVGMSGDEKAQLQAIYDKFITNGTSVGQIAQGISAVGNGTLEITCNVGDRIIVFVHSVSDQAHTLTVTTTGATIIDEHTDIINHGSVARGSAYIEILEATSNLINVACTGGVTASISYINLNI